jgi:hypothetical protein
MYHDIPNKRNYQSIMYLKVGESQELVIDGLTRMLQIEQAWIAKFAHGFLDVAISKYSYRILRSGLSDYLNYEINIFLDCNSHHVVSTLHYISLEYIP